MGTKKADSEQISSVKVAFWYLIGDILVKGITVIMTPIFTRLLTKEEYGNFSNFTSWESILLIFVTLDLSTSIIRAKYDFNDKMSEYISSITAISTLMTLLLYAVIEMNVTFFVDFFSMDIFYIRVLFVYFLFQPAYAYMQENYRIYRKYKLFLFFSLSTAVLRTVLSIALVYLMEDNYKARVYGYIAPVLFLYMGIYAYIWIKGKKVKWQYCKYALMIGVPLIPHSLAGILLSSSDRVMIQKICGPEQTALYTVAYTIATLVDLITTSLSKAWIPWFFDAMNEGKNKEIRKISGLYANGVGVAILGVMLVAPEILLILGGKEYLEAKNIIPVVMSGLFCRFIYTFYVNIELFYKKTFWVSVGTMIATAINIGLNVILIPQFGYVAAAYTTLIGFLAILLIHYGIVKFIMNNAQCYDNRGLFVSMLLFVILQFVCTALYCNDTVRYIVIALYATVFFYCMWKKRILIKEIVVKLR